MHAVAVEVQSMPQSAAVNIFIIAIPAMLIEMLVTHGLDRVALLRQENIQSYHLSN